MADLLALKDKIEAVIEPVIKDNFLELVDLEIAGANYLRIRVGKPGANIGLDDCAEISRKIEAALDAADVIGEKYFLEVSSPGINRPIKKKEDFTRFSGKKVKIVTREKINDTHAVLGILRGMNNDNVVVEEEHGRMTEVAFDIIKKANIDELE